MLKLNYKVILTAMLLMFVIVALPMSLVSDQRSSIPVSVDVDQQVVNKGDDFVTTLTVSLNLDQPAVGDKWSNLIIPLKENQVLNNDFGITITDQEGVVKDYVINEDHIDVSFNDYLSGNTISIIYLSSFTNDSVDGDTIVVDPKLISTLESEYIASPQTVTLEDLTSYQVEKRLLSNPELLAPGFDARYELVVTASGSGPIDNLQLVDEFASGAEVIVTDGIVSGNTITLDILNNMFTNRVFKTEVVLNYPNDVFASGDTVVNDVYLTNAGNVIDSDSHSLTLAEGGIITVVRPPSKIAKTDVNASIGSIPRDGLINFEIGGLDLEGNTEVFDYHVIDNVPETLRVYEIVFPVMTANTLKQVTVSFLDGSSDLIITDFSSSYVLDEALQENVSQIRFDFGDVMLPITFETYPMIKMMPKAEITEVYNTADIIFYLEDANGDGTGGNDDLLCLPPFVTIFEERLKCIYDVGDGVEVTDVIVYGSIDKQIVDAKSSYAKGDLITYQITVANHPSSPSEFVLENIYDVFDDGVVFASSDDFTLDGDHIKLNTGDITLTPGDSNTYSYQVEVVSELNATLVNQVYGVVDPIYEIRGSNQTKVVDEVVDFNGDEFISSSLYDDATTIINEKKVVIDKSNNSFDRVYTPERIKPGDDIIEYEVTLSNVLLDKYSPSMVNPSLVDVLDSRISYVADSIVVTQSNLVVGNVVVDGDQVTIDFVGELNPGEDLVFTYQAKLKDDALSGIIKNEISYVKSGGYYTSDSIFTSVDKSSIVADIAAQDIDKSVDKQVVEQGEVYTYSISYDNNGTTKISDIVVVDDLPRLDDGRGSELTPLVFGEPKVYVNGEMTELEYRYILVDGSKVSTLPSERNLVASVEISLVGLVFLPLDNLVVEFSMVVPNYAEVGTVFNDAYVNSIAYRDNGQKFKDLYNNTNQVTTQINEVKIDDGVIGNLVFLDVDDNAIFDETTDIGLDGVVVSLYEGGVLVAQTITNNGGYYLFPSLGEGDYVINISDNPDYLANELEKTTTLAIGNMVDEDIDFYFTPAKVTGSVYVDVNNNGLFDELESKTVEEVVIKLKDNATGMVYTTTTVGGEYQFVGLKQGSYQVLAQTVDGYWYTLSDNITVGVSNDNAATQVTLDAGVVSNIDFGIIKPGIISGFIWEDFDLDSLYDDSENLVQNISIRLRSDGTTIDSVRTDGSGAYEFLVYPGDYQLQLAQPNFYGLSDYVNDQDFDDNNRRLTDIFSVASDEHVMRDGAIYKLSSIRGTIYLDVDADMEIDEVDLVVPNAVVTLVNLDTGEEIVKTTNLNGVYRFNNLEPNMNYQVVVSEVADHKFYDVITIDALGMSNEMFLSVDEHVVDVDGLIYSQGRIIGDLFYDLANDGLNNNADTDLANVLVSIYDVDSTLVAEVYTDEFGRYDSGLLNPGSYYVEIAPIEGYYLVAPNQGDDNIDSDYLLDNGVMRTGVIDIFNHDDIVKRDGGFYTLGSLSGYLYEDIKADGVFDEGDVMLNDIEVALMQGPNLIATTHSVDGYYEFLDVVPGSYYVTIFDETLISSSVNSELSLGNEFNIVGTEDKFIATGAVMSGMNNDYDYDGGFYKLATVSGYIFLDGDQDLVLDPYEQMAEGLVIEFYLDGEVVFEVVTDMYGYFEAELIPGDYTAVVKEVTDGYLAASKLRDNNTISIGSGDNVNDLIGIIWQSGLSGFTVGDFVFYDKDANGVYDALVDEVLSDVVIDIYNSDLELIKSATTNVDGLYEANLFAGEYIFKINLDEGYNLSQVTTLDNENKFDQSSGSYQAVITGDNLMIDASVFTKGMIFGSIYDDLLVDQIFGEDDLVLSNMLVSLFNEQGELVMVTYTDEFGQYEFSSLMPGEYYVSIKLDDYLAVGNDNIVDGHLIGEMHSILNDEDMVEIITPLYLAASISGYIYQDHNLTGDYEALVDNFIPGVSIGLVNEFGMVIDTVVTDSLGHYEFSGLYPGEYTVEILDDAYLLVERVSELDLGNSFIDKQASDLLISGEYNNHDFDGALYKESYLSGTIFYDGDMDLVFDETEAPVVGSTVSIYNIETDMVINVETDEFGFYEAYVMPGDYLILGYDVLGSVYPDDSNLVSELLVGSDQAFTDLDRGVFIMADSRDYNVVSGNVFYDMHGDNMFDNGDLNLEGVVINVYDVDNHLIYQTTTDQDGYYEFGLFDGSYEFEVVLPSGYTLGEIAGSYDPTSMRVSLDVLDDIENLDAAVQAGYLIEHDYYLDYDQDEIFDPEDFILDEDLLYVFNAIMDFNLDADVNDFSILSLSEGEVEMLISMVADQIIDGGSDYTIFSLLSDMIYDDALVRLYNPGIIYGNILIDGELVDLDFLKDFVIRIYKDRQLVKEIIPTDLSSYHFEHLLPGSYVVELYAKPDINLTEMTKAGEVSLYSNEILITGNDSHQKDFELTTVKTATKVVDDVVVEEVKEDVKQEDESLTDAILSTGNIFPVISVISTVGFISSLVYIRKKVK